MPRLDDAGMHRARRRLRESRGRPRGRTRPLAGASPSVRRTGLSHGWPSGMRPCCSQTSRSNRCACGCVAVSDGIRASERRAAADGERVVGIEGQHRDQPQRRRLPARRTRRTGARRAPVRAAVARTNSATGHSGTSAHGRRWRWPAGRKEWWRSWRREKVVRPRRSRPRASTAGVNRPSHSDSRSSTSGGTITPAVSTKRRPRRPRGRARPAVHDGEHHPGQSEERQQQAAQEHRRRPRRARSPSAARTISSSLKNGPNGGQAVTANMPGDEDRRRARREQRPCRAPRPSTADPAARRMLPALRNSAPLVRLLLHT